MFMRGDGETLTLGDGEKKRDMKEIWSVDDVTFLYLSIYTTVRAVS